MMKENDELELEGLIAELERATSWYESERKERGMDFYEPNAGQMKAHLSMANTVLVVAGNRFGKSTFGAIELCFHLTKKYPSWYPENKRFSGPIRAVVSATEFPIVTRVIEPKIFQYLPRNYYTFKRTAQGYLSQIKCKDGSTVDILTSEMKDDAYEGANWHFAWLDEPQQQRKYEALRRGLVDFNGRMVITFTPLTEPWMKYELVDKADGVEIDVITGSIYDNQQTISGTPILKKESIDRFLSKLSEEYRATREGGTFFFMRGIVYKMFGEPHIKDFSYAKEGSGRCPVVCVLDPHDRNPHHLIWAFIDEQDDIHIDYEMIVHCELDELAKKILLVEKERGYKMQMRLIDPNFGRKPAAVGMTYSVMDELARHGAPFYEAKDDIELGHMIVRDYLNYDRNKPLTAINKPKLFFSKERVPVTIRSMRNYQYADWQGKTKEDKEPKEVPKEAESHGADCVRYLCITKPMYTNPYERIDEYELAGPVY